MGVCVCMCSSEPPMDRDDVPSGEWLCRKCNPPDVSEKRVDRFFSRQFSLSVLIAKVRGNGSCRGTPFDELIRKASNENPVAFSLPFQYRSNTVVPGKREREREKEKLFNLFATSPHLLL